MAAAPAGRSLLAAPQGVDAPYRITLDGATSQVTFELGAIFHTVHGKGQSQDAVLEYDPDTGTLNGAVFVAAPGLDTGNARRDRKMHADVLHSAEHGEIVLRTERADGPLDPATGGDLQIEGDLVLLGTPHPVSFPVEILITDEDTGAFRATGSFMVPYVAWGLDDPSAVFLRVDKEVMVSFAISGVLSREDPGSH